MPSLMEILLAGGLGYVLGSVPFGLLLAKVMGLGNLRQIGSGNIGATNVLRTGNIGAASMTLIFDIGKGAVAILLSAYIFEQDYAIAIAGVASVIGHCFPIWLAFKGGKGVATGIGVVLALNFSAGVGMALIWLIMAGYFRISSLSSITSYALAPLLLYGLSPEPGRLTFAVASVAIGLIILWRHRPNISRLLKGTEPRIGK